jgi:hypothetical protein
MEQNSQTSQQLTKDGLQRFDRNGFTKENSRNFTTIEDPCAPFLPRWNQVAFYGHCFDFTVGKLRQNSTSQCWRRIHKKLYFN